MLPWTRILEKLYELVAASARQRVRFALAPVAGRFLQTRCNEELFRLDEDHTVRVMDILLAAIPFAPVARTANLLADRVLIQDVHERQSALVPHIRHAVRSQSVLR